VHPHAQLIQRFYEAFDARDAETMAKCYHDGVVFEDPVFGELRGEAARDMWRMLCGRAVDLRVTHEIVDADDVDGEARWVATYKFGKAKRPVTNRIRAQFEFKDGLIARHMDTFSLWRWASQALGPTGALLGWAPPVRAKIRREARAGLDAFRRAR
jgi:ketosteroid isomerase-like protein